MEFEVVNALSYLVFLGFLSPHVTAILTRLRDPEWFKGVVSLVLVSIVGVVASLSDGSIVVNEALFNGFATWMLHQMSYYQVSKESVARLAKATVRFAPLSWKRGSIKI